MTGLRRCLDIGGIVEPAIFVADWGILDSPPYDPIRDTISRLAQTGVPTQHAMTVGFAVYGASLPLFALASGRPLPPASRAMVDVTGLSAVVVAAFAVSVRTGSVHAAAAGIGCVTLAAAPPSSTGPSSAPGVGVKPSPPPQ